MWPWEHVIFGYLLYSLFVRFRYGETPGGRATVVMAFAAVLPDLIDKPLAWEFGVFATGYALGHSVFFAVPLSLGVWYAAVRRGVDRLGSAFAIGYLSHLLGDVIPVSVRRGELTVDHLFWPVMVPEFTEPGGFSENVRYYLDQYVAVLLSGEPSPYLLVQLALFIPAILLWIADGVPPFGAVTRSHRNRIDSQDRPE